MPTLITDTVQPWLDYLAAQGLAPGYIKNARSAIIGPRVGFLGVVQRLKGRTPTTGQIDHVCVDKWLSAHQGGVGSRTNKLGFLRSYLDFLENRSLLKPGFTRAKLLAGYKAKHGERQPKHYIDAEDFPALLAVAHNPRDRAVLALGLYTLARQGEIAAITLSAWPMNPEVNVLPIYREKRKRWTESPISRELRAEMLDWLKAYADQQGYDSWMVMAAEHPDWYLVPAKLDGRAGWRLKPDTFFNNMERVVKLALTDLGVTTTRQGSSVEHVGEGMHTIRRSGARALFARLVKSSGYESALTFTQAMLDHESSDMTKRYIGMDWVKEQLNKWIIENGMYDLCLGISGSGLSAPS